MAGVAALVLQFAMQRDGDEQTDDRLKRLLPLLKKYEGMSLILDNMKVMKGGYRNVKPWKLLYRRERAEVAYAMKDVLWTWFKNDL